MKQNPLVSIIIYNFNYGKFLRECIESAINQTYENIEIIMSDNASTDDSWEIFMEFEQKYRDKFFIARNYQNFGTDHNFAVCWSARKGAFHVVLGSDDILEPTFVERAMHVMQAHPGIGYVMCHRSIIDAEGKKTAEVPFYDRSCIIYPPGQSLVYMMAAVNPSISQILYRSTMLTNERSGTGGLAGKYYATRVLDFNISIEFPIAYLKEPLIRHRLHGNNQNLVASDDLMEIIGFYVLNIQFGDKGLEKGFPELQDNLGKSTEKLSQLSLRYSLRSLLNDDFLQAKRYFYLAHALNPNILETEFGRDLELIFDSKEESHSKQKAKTLASKTNLVAREVSYPPPEPFEEIKI